MNGYFSPSMSVFQLFVMQTMRFFLILINVILCILFSRTSLSAPGVNPAELSHPINDDKHIRDRLLAEFWRWEGVKYKLGGNSRHGIDCSSLMQEIYHASFADRIGEQLPRTTSRQIALGKEASRETLRPGDLVFFSLSAGVRHVGVYIGDAQFIHASTSRGVMISSVDDRFWKKRFITGRRVFS
ncbi:NlpC/P60 family protein [Enterobacter sp. 148H3]|uniref:NlpC/P60 family protein n=1 Tax=Enterobacter sp. 148H3 TaxID=3077756 RepID=UPI0015EBBE91|nr:NlpC/P60 family protein [Enterobacter sp. 148H3]